MDFLDVAPKEQFVFAGTSLGWPCRVRTAGLLGKVVGRVFHFTYGAVICHSENYSTALLGFLFSWSSVDGDCSDLQTEVGCFLEKFSPEKGYGFI